jgi:hypothetical protein
VRPPTDLTDPEHPQHSAPFENRPRPCPPDRLSEDEAVLADRLALADLEEAGADDELGPPDVPHAEVRS